MIVVRRNRQDIANKLNKVFTTNGISLADSIARELINTSVDTLELEYSSYYAFAKNTRIDTADNVYLDSYGLQLDEPRNSATFAKVDTLDNVSLFLLNGSGRTTGGNTITSDGKGLLIEKGTVLKDKNGQPVLKTLNTVELLDKQVFVKCVSTNPGDIYIPKNGLALADIDIRGVFNVSPSLVSDFNLMCNNAKDIIGGSQQADENSYRFILQEKAHSVNLSNNRKLNTLMDNLDLRKFVVTQGNRNSTSLVIYIESKNIDITEILVEELKIQIESIFPWATDIRIRPFIQSILSVNLKINVDPINDVPGVREDFKQLFIREVINLEGGIPIDLAAFLEKIRKQDSRVISAGYEELLVNRRTLITPFFQTKNIEKLICYPSTISYKV